MKRTVSALLLLTLLLLLLPVIKPDAKAPAQDTAASDVRIMSANVLAEFASWSGGTAPEATSSRVVKLNKMLEENAPIAVGTQEMSPSWYTAFKKLDTTKWGWLEESDVAGYSYYNFVPNKGLALNSILYRKDLLTLNAHGVEAYSSRSNGQCIVWAVFTIQSSGKQFVMISTHWTPGADKANERLAQAEQLAKKVNSLRNTYGNTVICTGDFNCNDQTQEFRRFLLNSNSVDSRTGAASRGDHLNKIDHVTATGDASFSYHTICYEANNAYAISDHPFAVADVKVSSALLFDYTDTADSRAHYKQGNYRFNAYDYHEAYWVYDPALVSNRTINKADGTLTFRVSSSGHPYIMTATNNTTDPKTAYGLNFQLAEAEYARVKFRLTDCQLIDSAVTPSVTVGATNTSVGKWATDRKTYNFSKASSTYVSLYIPLTSSGVKSLSRLDSVRITFDNIKNGTVTIDSIYIGKDPSAPLSKALFFDYSNTTADQSRYGGTSYGGYNYDKGNWTTAGYGATKDFAFNNTEGTVAVKVKNTNDLGPVFATAPATGTYSWDTSGACLSYDPAKAEVMQIRFKLDGCQTVSGKNARVLLMYGGMYNGVFDGNNYENVKEYTYTDGQYLILTMALSDQFRQAEKITQVGVRFQYIASSAGGTATLDYLYIGPGKALPTKHVYDHKVTKPTCTAQGYTTHTCRTCAYSYQDTYVPAKAHTEVIVKAVAATCTAAGKTEGKHCSVCNTVIVAQQTIPAKGHTEVVDKAVAATCTATGKTEGKHCSVCSAVLVAQQTIPAKGHTEVVDKAVAATCITAGKTEGKHCSVCNAVLIAQEVIPAKGHSYTYTTLDGQTHSVGCQNCDLSETASHSYENGTCICGEPEIKDPVEDISLKLNHSLNLASDISVNLVVPKTLLNGFDVKTVYVESTLETYVGNEKTGVQIIRMEPVDNGYFYYFTLDGLTAVQMNDRISSVLYGTKDGQPYYSPVDEYSIATYAYAQLNKTGIADSLKTLCADLLRYGSKAQIFKAYRTDSLADAAMTEEQRAYLSDMETVTFGNTNRVLNDLPNAPVTWAGKSLNLESKVALKFVFNMGSFTGNLSDLSLRISYTDAYGNEKTELLTNPEHYGQGTGAYVFTLDTLLAAELRSEVSVQIFAEDSPVSATLQYSADTYGNNKTGTLLDLCKALFAYSDSAKAYFAV